MSWSMQLHYIPVTAFSLTDLSLNRVSLEWGSRGSAMTKSQETYWRRCFTGPELIFFHERKNILKYQSVKYGYQTCRLIRYQHVKHQRAASRRNKLKRGTSTTANSRPEGSVVKRLIHRKNRWLAEEGARTTIESRTNNTRGTPPPRENAPAPEWLTTPQQERKVEPDAKANLSNKPRRARTDTTEVKIVSGMPEEEITNIKYIHKNPFSCIEKKTIASLCWKVVINWLMNSPNA